MNIRLLKPVLLIFLSAILFCPWHASGQDVLTLEEAISIALDNNYSIKIVRNTAVIAANNNTLGNAGFLPRVDVGLAKTENRYSQKSLRADNSIVEGSNLKSDNLSSDIELSWTIFDGFAMFVQRDRYAKLEEAAGYQTVAQVASLVAEVSSAYYAIVQQQKLVNMTRQSMDLSKQRKEISDAKIRIGSGSRLMLLQSQVDFNADSAILIQRLLDSSIGKSQLNRLLAREITVDFDVFEDLAIEEGLQYDELLDRMKAQNPNLEIARINKDLSELEIKAYKSNYYPRVDISGGYTHTKSNFPPGFSFTQNTRRNGVFYGFGISWNIFNGTYVSPNIQSTRIESINQDYTYNENELLLSSQLYEAFRDYEANLSLVLLETDNLGLARENVKIALEQYQLGVINDIDLRAIQLKQIESETNLLVSQFRAKQSEIELKLISGSLTVSN